MLRKKPMSFRIVTEQRQAAGIAHHDAEPRMDEGFPVVRIDQHPAAAAIADRPGDAPVATDPVPLLPFVFRKGNARRGEIYLERLEIGLFRNRQICYTSRFSISHFQGGNDDSD